jgi:hypothetical protein
MPIHECDPWRGQYFDNIACPDDVIIPTDDPDAWQLYPAHRWIYDKLAVALSQGLEAAPHGVMPPHFPVFSKPITNLRGMGVDSRAIGSEAEYETALTAGHFWSTLLTGAHVSSDAVLVDGRPQWWRHTTGITAPGGTFDYWHIHPDPMPEIEGWCATWSAKHLTGYTGMVNFETIGSRIIEAHLRFADQWPDLYGPGWVDAVVRLYATGQWHYPDANRSAGYSVVLFGPHGRPYRHPSAATLGQVRAMDGVSSVQITFHEDKDAAHHAMPPGGFRLAVINAHTLAAGQTAREHLSRELLKM